MYGMTAEHDLEIVEAALQKPLPACITPLSLERCLYVAAYRTTPVPSFWLHSADGLPALRAQREYLVLSSVLNDRFDRPYIS